MSDEVYIVSACRTPIGKNLTLLKVNKSFLLFLKISGSLLGAFKSVPAHDLGGAVIAEALKRAKINPQNVNEVVIGQVCYIYFKTKN